jgi:acyl-CoA thioesterase FadM
MIRSAPGDLLATLAEDVHEVPLRPNDFDVSGHLNNSAYFEVMEAGRWHWAHANGLDIEGRRLVAVVAELHVEFLRPVQWHPLRRLWVRSRPCEATHYGLVLAQSIEEDVGGTLSTRARVRLALYDISQRRIRPLRLLRSGSSVVR